MLVLIYMVLLCLILHLMALHLSVRLTTISHSMVLASLSLPHLFYCSIIIVSEPEFIDLYERGDHYYFFMRETARETGDVSLRPVSCCSCC